MVLDYCSLLKPGHVTLGMPQKSLVAKRDIIARIIGDMGLQEKRLRRELTYAHAVKPIGIGLYGGLSLDIGEHNWVKLLPHCGCVK